MKGLVPLFLGIFGTFAFSWVGLTVIPNWQIGHLNPQMEEDGTDVYPQPQSGMVERGARVYAANGCNYCHSQQVRAEYAAADIERKWGDRRSAPRDYIFERSVFLGKMRMGQDLANIGARAPAEQENAPAPPAGGAAPAGSPGQQPAVAPLSSPARSGASPNPPPKSAGSPAPNALPAVAGSPPKAAGSQSPSAASPAPKAPAPQVPNASPGSTSAPAAANATPGGTTSVSSGTSASGELPIYSATWQHRHLYSPRSINIDSNMPSYRFLYQTRQISDAPSVDALHFTGSDAPPEGWEIVPNYDAKCLVAYLMSLNQSHPLKEVRSAAPAAASPPPAPGK